MIKESVHQSPLRDKSSRSTPSKVHHSTVNIEHVRACFVPYAAKPKTTSDHQPVTPRRKHSHPREPPKIRTTKAQEERAKFNAALNNKDRDANHAVKHRYILYIFLYRKVYLNKYKVDTWILSEFQNSYFIFLIIKTILSPSFLWNINIALW